MQTKINKAVFPLAGIGALAPSASGTGNMLAIVDKPLLQYAIEEALAAGVAEMVFVAGKDDSAMQAMVTSLLPSGTKIHFIRIDSREPIDALLCTEDIIGNDPFAVIHPADLVDAETPALKQLLGVHASYGTSVIGVETIAREYSDEHAVIAGSSVAERTIEVRQIVTNPAPVHAPSTLAAIGRYVLMPSIFQQLRMLKDAGRNKATLNDAIDLLLKNERVIACQFEGIRYDCASTLGFLQATVQFGLRHPGVSNEFRAFLRNLPFIHSAPTIQLAAALPQINQAIAIAG
ncbi:sugar phosphate nucleotidyltransferase [Noviherbaspirillum sp. CPCC 100848]|uniref:UTP--glucose-1-phosphate uridylyltransferase n=1 Tax=Noviherbaspirillum album TaxID=3080276 RepID=A0ABU6JE95_9BURK|nr:sugar phosphate nucleotidyltransferase [Noviherbaspirillum sp. CPCC 100848]MEC4721969.1 sugar phosphate nucleotidyltransferase [Noviherbaspirillum sp. CPCC 100848]